MRQNEYHDIHTSQETPAADQAKLERAFAAIEQEVCGNLDPKASKTEIANFVRNILERGDPKKIEAAKKLGK